jgi:hypothetical protein
VQRLRACLPLLQPQAERGWKVTTLPEWHPDCGGDWVLSGDRFFANYWPDNTVIADVFGENGEVLHCSGIMSFDSKAQCQAFAEMWILHHMRDGDATAQAKLDAIRTLVNESVARMEPVSWIDALTEILDGDSNGQA